MEIKSMSSVSNTNFENFDRLKQAGEVRNNTSSPKLSKTPEVQEVSPAKEEKGADSVVIGDQPGGGSTAYESPKENEKSFNYDLETNTFMIIVKDKEGRIQQYPTEDLLKFKQMIKQELKSELIKELGRK